MLFAQTFYGHYKSTCVSQHPQKRTEGFWWQQVHLHYGEDAEVIKTSMVLLSRLHTITIQYSMIIHQSSSAKSHKSANKTNSALQYHTTTTSVLRPFFLDHPGELVPEKNFWTLWCKGRLTEADTLTIRLGTTPAGLTSAHLHQSPIFFTGRMPFLLLNQQCQSNEGNSALQYIRKKQT